MTEMTASVTLSLRDQLTGGLDDVLGVLRDIRAMMTELREATQGVERQLGIMAEAFKPAQDAASGVVREVAAVGKAATASTREITAMGAALREARVAGDVGVVPRGTARGARHGVVGAHAAEAGDLIGDAIAGYVGYDAIKSFSDFLQPLVHAGITKELEGRPAIADALREATKMQDLALQTGTSSRQLADAYYSLVTQHIDPKTVDLLMRPLGEASTAYNTPVGDVAGGVFALIDTLHVPVAQLGTALSTLGIAAKQAHFDFAGFSRYMPGLAAQERRYGVTSLAAVRDIAKEAEIVIKSSTNKEQAAAYLQDLYQYIGSPMASRMFSLTKGQWSRLAPSTRALLEHSDIKSTDLEAVIESGVVHGLDPATAMRNWFAEKLKDVKNPVQQGFIIGAFLHNMGAQQAMLTMVQQKEEEDRMARILKGVGPGQIGKDFATASLAPEFTVQVFDEELAQLTRVIGEGLLPELKELTVVLGEVVKLAHHFPGFTSAVVQGTGIGLTLRTLRTGWRLLRSAFGFGAAGVAGAAEGEGGSLAFGAGRATAALFAIPGVGEAAAAIAAVGGVAALMYDAREHVQALHQNTAALQAAAAATNAAAADPVRRPLGVGGWGPMHGLDWRPRVHGPDQTLGRP